MKKKNANIKKGLILVTIGIVGIMAFAGCGKKKKLHYGDTEGVVSGNITFNDDKADFKLDNVIAPVGTDIDYTSAITTSGEGEDYSMEVNATNVKYDKPGTYTAHYTVKSGSNTYTDSIKVTITDKNNSTDDLSYDKGSENLNVSDNQGNNAGVNSGSSNNQGGNSNSNNNSNPINQGGNGSSPSGGTDNSGNGSGNNEQNNPTQETGKKVLITNGESITYEKKDIPNAVIELLSGDVVTISCSTNKYIVSTRTEETQTQKNGKNYKVTKLIVKFNTGNEQTLETIEKRID